MPAMPRTAAPEVRRAALLAAARQAFATRGYEGTTVAEIARGAGVAQGTVYLYFDSKEAIARAFAEELAARLGRATEDATKGAGSFAEAVAAAQAAAYAESKKLADVLLVVNRAIESVTSRAELERILAPHLSSLESMVARWMDEGEVDASTDARTLARVLRDLMDRAVKWALILDDPSYMDETVALMRRCASR